MYVIWKLKIPLKESNTPPSFRSRYLKQVLQRRMLIAITFQSYINIMKYINEIMTTAFYLIKPI